MDVAAGWRNRPKVAKGPALVGRRGRRLVVLVRLVVNGAGLAGGEAVVHISAAVTACPRTTEVRVLQRDCFDGQPILQDGLEALGLI
jgi:hypothetical protein